MITLGNPSNIWEVAVDRNTWSCCKDIENNLDISKKNSEEHVMV